MSLRRFVVGAGLACLVLGPLPAGAGEEPVSGALLRLEDLTVVGGQQASVDFRSDDAALSAPFADPSQGATFFVGASSATGQCRIEFSFLPDHWSPIAGDGAQNGYTYAESTPRGLLVATYAQGRIHVLARGALAACDRSLPQQVPLDVELRVGAERYCAAFGGSVDTNAAGRFEARDAPAPVGCTDSDATLAQLNIYHGHDCDPPVPDDGDQCRLADRLDLLVDHIADAGCPDLVTMQEHIVKEFQQVGATEAKGPLDNTVEELEARLPGLAATCGFLYEVIFDPEGISQTQPRGNDEEVILTRYPALEASVTHLYTPTEPFFVRHVMYARIDHPIGPLDVYTTHMSAGVDAGGDSCGVQIELLPGAPSPPCPAECDTSMTVRQCQAVQIANLVAATHDVPQPAFVTGDFNDVPNGPSLLEMTDRGWIDTYLAVGNPECEPLTGVGCTSGRETDTLADFENPTANVDRRIDYAMLIPPGPGSSCVARLDPIGDEDGDGTRTRIFADEPNPFAASCGPLPLPLCWPSDHEGAEVDLDCAPADPPAGALPEPGRAVAAWAGAIAVALLARRRGRRRGL